MGNEITTEVLANAIDATKGIVQTNKDTVKLIIQGQEVDYQIIHKAASDKDSQLNAMAIAPLVNGKPDYNNIGVVYAGTNLSKHLYGVILTRITIGKTILLCV